MAEILHFEILRKHGQTNTQTHKQTNTQTDMGITIPRPPPMGGEVIMGDVIFLILHKGDGVLKLNKCLFHFTN